MLGDEIYSIKRLLFGLLGWFDAVWLMSGIKPLLALEPLNVGMCSSPEANSRKNCSSWRLRSLVSVGFIRQFKIPCCPNEADIVIYPKPGLCLLKLQGHMTLS